MNEAMSNNCLLERLVVNTVLPLIPWTLQKFCGPMFSRDQWREIARSFVPPSQSTTNVILEQIDGPINPAILSPTWRRKLRSRQIHLLRRRLHGNTLAVAARRYLLEWKAKLAQENMGYSPTPKPIRKLADIEAERRMEFAEMVQKPEEISKLFPPEKVLDPRVYSQMMKELGTDSYNLQVIGLLMEFALRGKSTVRAEITSRSNLWSVIGVDPKMLDSLPPEHGMILILDTLFNKFGVGIGEPDEEGLCKMTEWTIRTHLPRIVLGAGYTVRDDREVCLATPISESATIGDTLQDEESSKFTEEVEAGIDYQMLLKELPPAQRRALELFVAADKQGITLRDICTKENENYVAVRQNLKRARERLRKAR